MHLYYYAYVPCVIAYTCIHKKYVILTPGQNGRHFGDDIVQCVFMNEKIFVLYKISLKFIHKDPINNI